MWKNKQHHNDQRNFVYPPFASRTAETHFGIDSIRLWIISGFKLFQHSLIACHMVSWLVIANFVLSLFKCLIELRSGDWGGKSITTSKLWSSFLYKYFLLSLEVCLGSSSCCKINPWPDSYKPDGKACLSMMEC